MTCSRTLHGLTGSLAMLLAGCASSGHYMGIDTGVRAGASSTSLELSSADREGNLLMAMALAEDCFERVPGGFRQIQVPEAHASDCTVPPAGFERIDEYTGFGPGFAELSLVSLARMARSGNRQAQLELGIRFEEGIGIGRDIDRARELYRKAASAAGGPLWIYTPSVGNGTKGRVVPIDRGPRQPGLAEAKRRLAALGD